MIRRIAAILRHCGSGRVAWSAVCGLPTALTVSCLLTFLAVPVYGQDSVQAEDTVHGQRAGGLLRPVEGEDFVVYDRGGRASSFAAVLQALSDTDVVLVGEEHDDMVGHRFQTELLGAAYRRLQAEGGRQVILSLEMFERDVQYILAEYLDGVISEAHFLSSSRPWPDYEKRYRPLVEFAKAHRLTVVAANAPRRYVNRVSREGPESLQTLSATAKSFLPPLPYPGPSEEYRAQWDALMAEAMSEMQASTDSAAAGAETDEAEADEADIAEAEADETAAGQTEAGEEDPDESESRHYVMSPNVIYSQALWDAAMGHAVTSALGSSPGSLVIHMAGSFHVERGTGIPERVADYAPGTRVVSIVMVSVDEIAGWDEKEHEGLGDFVVFTRKPEAVTDGSGS